jgi:glycerophosphoryl diester phosphodiesterase
MRFIAHRILRDGKALDSMDEGRLAAHHGVELDLRLGVDGGLVVRHSPLFGGGRGHRRGVGHPFRAVARRLTEARRPPGLLLLDVKCAAAAQAAALEIAADPPEAAVTFVCWHADEVVAIRAILPAARILFCIAPIMARRERERSDFYLANQFPFLWPAERFMPALDKHNRHNINVRLLAPDCAAIPLPQGVDGVCLHRVFWKPELAALTRAQGLEVAVYGLSGRARAFEAAAVGRFDLAILGKEKSRVRMQDAPHAAAAHSRPIAA